MDPIIGGALIGAGGMLTQGIFGASNNERNIAMARETNAQNERLMREAWSREDNAVQRRTADLKAAGLSPVLAAGSAAAASNPIKLDAPQSADYMSPAINAGVQSMMAANNMASTKMDNFKKLSEIYGIDYNMKLQEFDRKISTMLALKQMGVLTADEAKKWAENETLRMDNQKQKDTLVNPRSGNPVSKMAADAYYTLKTLDKSFEAFQQNERKKNPEGGEMKGKETRIRKEVTEW